jgi:hypothetical protein
VFEGVTEASMPDGALMLQRHDPASLIPMAAGEWQVIVVRAWRDGDQVRARIIVTGDRRREWVIAGVPGATEIFAGLLEELLAGAETPPDTPR